MLEQLHFLKKYALLPIVVVLLFVGYQFAIKSTVAAWRLNRQLHKQLEQEKTTNFQPGSAQKQIGALNKIIRLYQVDTATYKTVLLNAISVIAEKDLVKISELPAPDLFYQSDALHIQTIELNGDYFGLIRVLRDVEQTKGIGLPRSISISREKNPGNKDENSIKLSILMGTTY